MKNYEKLGAFYLGRRYHPDSGDIAPEPLLYDSRDLTTHAVIIGMTGSGKTGLGISLLEEAAIDRIPVLAIDPKGDLGNLLLNFPQLRGEDFLPWVDPAAAQSEGLSSSDFASGQAKLWREGLADWDTEPERIGRLADSVDMAIYTPGSRSGRPLSILGSLRAPSRAVRDDPERLREQAQTAVSGLLTLLGIDADPLISREHILMSRLFLREWEAAREVSLASLISAIQHPDIEHLGVLPLDDVFPPKQRQDLAMRLNNLLASPGFSNWLSGDPMDAQSLLYSANGKPRLSIVNIAHLSDAERMSVVTLLLAELISWMRSQPGTGSLRALLYMDEIFGYLPPTANPPSKQLLLTLLKQARAFGLGLVLSTQNPVDLDYKALSNAGTWFIGRLQTDQDRSRVLDGLRGAGTDIKQLETWLGKLGKRRFLLHNVHDAHPVAFATRWALSYLAGPLASDQIRRLSGPHADAAPPPATATPELPGISKAAPRLPSGLKSYTLPLPRRPAPGEGVIYRPCLLAAADAHYHNTRHHLDHHERLLLALTPSDGPVALDWSEAERLELTVDDLQSKGAKDALYAPCPAALLDSKAAKASWPRAVLRHIRIEQPLTLWHCATLKQRSTAGESEAAFRIRLQQHVSEQRDSAVDTLRDKYESRLNSLQSKLLKAEQAIERESQQSQQSKLDAALSFGSVLLGAFLGRKALSATNARRVGSVARRAGRIRKEAGDVDRAQEREQVLREQISELGQAFEQDVAALEKQLDSQQLALKKVTIKAKSSDIQLHFVALGWRPEIGIVIAS